MEQCSSIICINELFFGVPFFKNLAGLLKKGWAIRCIFFIFPQHSGEKIKKDTASISNAVGKGTSKSIPKKVLLVNMSYVTFTT
ncbi:MAG: hypothetical protein ACJAQ7_000509 [Sediminicola sp.]